MLFGCGHNGHEPAMVVSFARGKGENCNLTRADSTGRAEGGERGGKHASTRGRAPCLMSAGGGAEAASENADPSPAGAGGKRETNDPSRQATRRRENRRPKPRRDKDAPRQTAKEGPTGQSQAERPRAGRGPTKAGARREKRRAAKARRPEKTRGGGAESKAESGKDTTRDREEPSEDSRRSRQTPQGQARHRAQSQGKDKAGRRRKESHDPTEPGQQKKRDGSNPRGTEQTRETGHTKATGERSTKRADPWQNRGRHASTEATPERLSARGIATWRTGVAPPGAPTHPTHDIRTPNGAHDLETVEALLQRTDREGPANEPASQRTCGGRRATVPKPIATQHRQAMAADAGSNGKMYPCQIRADIPNQRYIA